MLRQPSNLHLCFKDLGVSLHFFKSVFLSSPQKDCHQPPLLLNEPSQLWTLPTTPSGWIKWHCRSDSPPAYWVSVDQLSIQWLYWYTNPPKVPKGLSSSLGQQIIFQMSTYPPFLDTRDTTMLNDADGLPWWFSSTEPACQCRRARIQPLDPENPLRKETTTHFSVFP